MAGFYAFTARWPNFYATPTLCRLHALLTAADVPNQKELVFVGWSNGCIYIRRMLERHPEVKAAVKGIVFIDSYHECSAQWLDEAGVTNMREVMSAKHTSLEKIRGMMNFAVGTGLASCFMANKYPETKTNFVTALMYEVLIRSETGWDGTA